MGAASCFNLSNEATHTFKFSSTHWWVKFHCDFTIRAAIQKKVNVEHEKLWRSETFSLLETFSDSWKKKIERKLEHWCSGWLSVLPTTDTEFCMSAGEFWDSLVLDMVEFPRTFQLIVMQTANYLISHV